MEDNIYELRPHELNPSEILASNKQASINEFFQNLERNISAGRIDADIAFLICKHIEKNANHFLKKIEQQAIKKLDERDEYSGVGLDGYVLKFKEGARVVDYSEVKEIQTALKVVKDLKDKHKNALTGVERLYHGKPQTVITAHATEDQCAKWRDDDAINDLAKWKYNKSSLVLTKKN